MASSHNTLLHFYQIINIEDVIFTVKIKLIYASAIYALRS